LITITGINNCIGNDITQFIDGIVPTLNNVLKSNDYDPEAKPNAIGTLGDLIM
jgi:hypothetical protein